jgi:hypothetical protein
MTGIDTPEQGATLRATSSNQKLTKPYCSRATDVVVTPP